MNKILPQDVSVRHANTARILILIGLYFTTFYSYLLFHTLAEIFSIVIAFSLFVISSNSRKYIRNQYLIMVGIAYLFIAFIDLIHTLAYSGMNIFTDYSYYANQLWLGARYMESLTLLAAFFMLKPGRKINETFLYLIYFISTAFLMASIFIWKIFPVCFIEGAGQTSFKILSEYIICAILFSALVILKKRKKDFDLHIYRLLQWSLVFTIISELAFAVYIHNYGISNLIGHYFKIFSFYLIYKAIIQTGITSPYEMIFRDLDAINSRLNEELEIKMQNEIEREKLISELTDALGQVKSLGSLLPICAYCKKIRDDKGYWNQLEEYISTHSNTDFSHSICPDCQKKYYSDLIDDEANDTQADNG